MPENNKSITIRTFLRPGDIGYVIHLHGKIYGEEYGYGLGFEGYVAESMAEFCHNYNPGKDKVGICEADAGIVGFLSLVNRGDASQLRYFLIEKAYRGSGLGNRLMNTFMNTLADMGYEKAYLLTSDDLPAAASLYMKHGFRLVSEEENDQFGKRVKLQRYELNLP